MIQPYWTKRHDGLGEQAIVMERPDVLLEVRRVPTGVQLSIAAIFSRIPPSALLLRKELMAEGHNVWSRAKLELARLWHEEHMAWKEHETLREMFRQPRMTASELSVVYAQRRRARMEAVERAGARGRAIIADRLEAKAKAGLPS